MLPLPPPPVNTDPVGTDCPHTIPANTPQADASLVDEVWAQLYAQDGQGRRLYEQDIFDKQKMFHEFGHPCLQRERRASDVLDERAVNLAGAKLYYHDPGLIAGKEPFCPICKATRLSRKQMGTGSGGVRRCIPRNYVIACQYKFRQSCISDGCAASWKAGDGAGSMALYSYVLRQVDCAE